MRIKNIEDLTQDDLRAISRCLTTFENYLRDITRKPTEENIALYEHWVDCRGDIQDIIMTEEEKNVELD